MKRKYAILQFGMISGLLMIYFILNFLVHEMVFESNIKRIFNHNQATRQRSSLLKYYMTFLQEGLVNLQPILEESSQNTLLSIYSSLIQDNDDIITSTIKSPFPSQFNSYLTEFQNINYQSVCIYSSFTISPDQQLSCSNISTLNSGAQRVVTQIGVNGNSVLAKTLAYVQSMGTKITYTAAQLSSSAYKDNEDLMVFISPTLDIMNDKLQSAYNDYLNYKNTIDKLSFSLFAFSLVIIFIFIWSPYLDGLIRRIWMTKGVLNMIPIEIILKHEKLRQAFTAGDILSAVK